MSGKFRGLSIGGVNVVVHPALLLLIWLAHFLGAREGLWAMMLALVLHESTHAVAARMLGLRVASVEFMPFGGVAKLEGYMEFEPRREMLIALAGPAANLVLMLMMAYAPKTAWSVAFIQSNMVLMLVNLFPALPLDGGRVLRAALAPSIGLLKATRLTAAIGMAAAVAFLAAGIWGLISGMVNLTIFTVSAYLLYAAARARREAPWMTVRGVSQKRRLLDEKPVPVRVLALPRGQTLGKLMPMFSPGHYHVLMVMDARMGVEGWLTEKEVTAAWMSGGGHVTVGALLKKGENAVETLPAGVPLLLEGLDKKEM